MTSTTASSKATKTVTDDDIYRQSSQFKKWSFTPTQLAARRLQTNTNGREFVKQSFLAADLDPAMAKILSVDEELTMVNYMCSQSEGIAQVLNLPSKVKATAVLFFKKFFLINSVMVYSDPVKVLHTCFFLATKAENHFFSINQFCKYTGAVAKDVLQLEFVVMQSMLFSLSAQSAYTPLHGFYLDIQTSLPHVPASTVGSLYDGARKYVSLSFLTDANFLFTPPQISLAAMMCTNSQITEQYLRVKMSDPAQFNLTTKLVQECVDMLQKVDKPTKEYVQEIGKKLRSCDVEKTKARLLKRKLKEQGEGDAKKQKLDSETPQPPDMSNSASTEPASAEASASASASTTDASAPASASASASASTEQS
ncbi:cyclin-like protein [Yarrowia lipolytica]|uniref:Cyclin-like protein n=1 Tax=Yarrowia lipolytica TaxID=4952 RepID=A0A1D8N3Y6_YARLL|nr:hypothetical protein YALI1_A06666g [Yarrowia lipolytica]KAB8281790.1 cyclin-like protein [Yarrowia lipolytica]KAE8170427.1 cyclin-like protein [Yarrowia lipolytica]KAJ8051435.1 cyclin-like protein [Yarrowia lipolytica]RMI97103.1 cyclin-like protein [Yarrowia lipolytica]